MNQFMEKELPKKDLILKVTLELIDKEGFEGVTVRKIADLANVNAALVNYHFGSKDKLLNEVVQILLSSFKECYVILEDTSIEPKQRLRCFLIKYLAAFHKYPSIIRRLLNEEVLFFKSQAEFTAFLKAMGLKQLQDTIKELTGENDPQKLTIIITQLLGAVFLPTLLEPIIQAVTGFTVSDIETQIEILLNHYFAK